MQIPVKLAKPGQLPEWFLIELQGTIESSGFNGAMKSIGNLFFTKAGEPILIIGHHELRGKETKLDKPYLVLRKRREISNPDVESTINQSTRKVSYEIAAVAKHKLLFKSRPKPIVTITKNTK